MARLPPVRALQPEYTLQNKSYVRTGSNWNCWNSSESKLLGTSRQLCCQVQSCSRWSLLTIASFGPISTVAQYTRQITDFSAKSQNSFFCFFFVFFFVFAKGPTSNLSHYAGTSFFTPNNNLHPHQYNTESLQLINNTSSLYSASSLITKWTKVKVSEESGGKMYLCHYSVQQLQWD